MREHTTTTSHKLTGEILIAEGVVNQAQLEIALKEQRSREGPAYLPIGEILVRNRFCGREQVEAAISRHTGAELSGGFFNALLPQALCRRYNLLPERVEQGILIVKAGGPLSPMQREAVIRACSMPVIGLQVRAVSKQVLEREFSRTFADTLVLSDTLDALRRQEPTGPLIQAAITALLKEALDLRASDIHLDYRGDSDSWISWRIDGILHRKFLIPRRVMGPLVIRLKTEAGMDASETRREQDGRIHYQYAGRTMDFRMSTMPMMGGEGTTLRVIDAESMPSIEALFPHQDGLTDSLAGYLRVREKRGGFILVSGQTGSGKSTTLGVLARMLPRERCNVLTLEDPVEIELPLSRQYQPNALLHQTMAQVERTFLRQDPDIIIIGEIRDADSACTALKMVESGHMVLASVHAESPVQALLRVVSMAAERETREWAAFVVSQFLKVSINQSLWAMPCPACAIRTPAGVRVHEAGCDKCHSGRRGRVLVHDSLFLGKSVTDLERYALEAALRTGTAEALRAAQDQQGVRRITRESIVRLLVAEHKLALEDLEEYAVEADAAKDIYG